MNIHRPTGDLRITTRGWYRVTQPMIISGLESFLASLIRRVVDSEGLKTARGASGARPCHSHQSCGAFLRHSTLLWHQWLSTIGKTWCTLRQFDNRNLSWMMRGLDIWSLRRFSRLNAVADDDRESSLEAWPNRHAYKVDSTVCYRFDVTLVLGSTTADSICNSSLIHLPLIISFSFHSMIFHVTPIRVLFISIMSK